MSRESLRPALILSILLLFMLSCDAGRGRPVVPEGLLSPGAVVDSFVAPSLDGAYQAVRFPASTVVVLQVGAFDCELCRQQWEAMRQVAGTVSLTEVRFIAVTLDDASRDEAIGVWVRAAGDPFEIWRDHDRRIADAVGLDGIPRLLVIGKDGAVLHRERGVPTGITPRWVSALAEAVGRDIPFNVAPDFRRER